MRNIYVTNWYKFLHVCEDINMPIAVDKTHWATEIITFLVMLLDTARRLILIPLDKKERAVPALRDLLN